MPRPNRKKNWNKASRLQRKRHAYGMQMWSGNHRAVRYVAWCPTCQKQALDKPNARKQVRLMRATDPRIRKYQCPVHPELGWWHVGHIPERVKKGDVSMQEVYKEVHDEAYQRQREKWFN